MRKKVKLLTLVNLSPPIPSTDDDDDDDDDDYDDARVVRAVLFFCLYLCEYDNSRTCLPNTVTMGKERRPSSMSD